eukprot:8285438-Alexandrium_andersonii.AAC.1
MLSSRRADTTADWKTSSALKASRDSSRFGSDLLNLFAHRGKPCMACDSWVGKTTRPLDPRVE